MPNNKGTVLIFGASGLAGSAVFNRFKDVGWNIIAPDRSQCNAASLDSVKRFFHRIGTMPDVVVNCVANANVDKNGKDSWDSNVLAPRFIGEACIDYRIPLLIHISTDYVFNRHSAVPIDEKDQNYSPCNEYGRQKLMADMSLVGMYDNWNYRNEAHPLKLRIVRTSSLFGPGRETFVDIVIKNYLAGGEVYAIDSGSSIPTSTRHLANHIVELAEKEAFSEEKDIFDNTRYFKNCVCNTSCPVSRMVLAQTVMEIISKKVYGSLTINKANDWDFGAVRPMFSQLKPSDKILAPYWKDELVSYISEIRLTDEKK